MAVHRRDGIWWTEFELNGRNYSRSTKQTSKQAALEYECRLRTHLYDLKRAGRTKEMTLGEALDRYTETVIFTKRPAADNELRHSSKNDLLRKNVLEEYFGRDALLIEVVKLGVIADFNFHLMKRMQPQSANRHLSLLRAVLNKAYQWGALTTPPVIPLNREQRPTNRALSELEERRLLKAVPDKLRDIVTFVLDTGARREEAFTLTWDRVDLERKPRPVVYFMDTKTDEHRCVPLPKRTTKMLRRRKRAFATLSPLVFAIPATRDIYNNRGELYARKGEMIRTPSFQMVWRRLREKLGMPEMKMHDLRHTYATKLVSRGVPLVDVNKLLGHRSFKSTMRYAYLAVDQLDRAVAVLDD
jgi:integrase